MQNIFLNIIILFSPNYDKTYVPGSSMKKTGLMEQFVAFYKSIKLNFKTVKYNISIVHYNNFNEHDLKILNNMDLDLLKIDTDNIISCAMGRYDVITKIKGTHRLIAETDMLLLKEPVFNWDVDFQAGFAGAIVFDKKTIDIICEKYKFKKIKNDKYKKNKLFIEYNIKNTNYKNLFPHFNNGLILVKEKFSHEIYEHMLKYNIFNISVLLNLNKQYSHYIFQFIMGPLLTTLTNNWKPFCSGINYLAKVYNPDKFGKNNISLLHYCGVNGDIVAKKYFPEYFI